MVAEDSAAVHARVRACARAGGTEACRLANAGPACSSRPTGEASGASTLIEAKTMLVVVTTEPLVRS
jgi:hypothetical protein